MDPEPCQASDGHGRKSARYIPDRPLLTLSPPTADHVCPLVEPSDQGWDVARIVLEVAIQCDHDASTGGFEPRGEGSGLSEGPAMPEHAEWQVSSVVYSSLQVLEGGV